MSHVSRRYKASQTDKKTLATVQNKRVHMVGFENMKVLPREFQARVASLVEKYPTPFYLYDEAGIRAQTRDLIEAFSWNNGFKEYFAVKALPNPAILSLLKEEKCGADCSSLAELILAERAGIRGEEVMLTSNDTPPEEFIKAKEMGALINLDALEHIEYLERHAGLPETLSFRYNPGPERTGNAIIGKPEEAKFGMTRAQLFSAYRSAKAKGVKRFGLHTMVVSNELNPDYFIETARMLFVIAKELREKEGIVLEFINLGGGIGIPYRPEQEPMNIAAIARGIKAIYEEFEMNGTKLFMECGRFITGPFGFLVSRVRHVKTTYKTYVGLDASMADLMRPGMYGAYHHITVLGKEDSTLTIPCDVVGSLCENNDKFAIDRTLPEMQPGDVVVIHDAGAHGHAMGFNYNGKLRHAELLLRADGSAKQIRRAETLDDYFATLETGV